MKKTKLLYILLIIIILCIGFVTYIYASNKLNNKLNITTENINSNKEISDNVTPNTEENKIISKWYYIEIQTYNMDQNDENYNISLKYLEFKELSIEICYEEGCYSFTYIIEDNSLIIEKGDYLSGEFEIKYEGAKIYLKQTYIDDITVIYVFTKEDK